MAKVPERLLTKREKLADLKVEQKEEKELEKKERQVKSEIGGKGGFNKVRKSKSALDDETYAKIDKLDMKSMERVDFDKEKIREQIKKEVAENQEELTPELSEKRVEQILEYNDFLKNNMFMDATTPKYNRIICSCCGAMADVVDYSKNFYPKYNILNANRLSASSEPYSTFCRTCANKLYRYYLKEYGDDEIKAMERWCLETNTYWDLSIYKSAKRAHEKSGHAFYYATIPSSYLSILTQTFPRYEDRDFWHSPCIQLMLSIPEHNYITTNNDKKKIEQIIKNFMAGEGIDSTTKKDTKKIMEEVDEEINSFDNPYKIPKDWSREGAAAKRRILRILRYDPFEGESLEDQKLMFKSLDTILDDEMENDFIKQQAALEIVRSFQKIDRIRKEENKVEKSDMTSGRLKELSDLRKKEFEVLSKISADQGFSVKFGLKKSRGAGTLTGVMNEMTQKHYQPSLVNYYDVATCKEMQEVANMSMEAIFKQLSLGENELYDITKAQTERILNLQRDLDKALEDLRQANIQLEEIRLKEIAAKQRREDGF